MPVCTSVPRDSTLIEFPVFGATAGPEGRRRELEWMIFEVSEEHVRTKTLPLLVAEYLGSGNEDAYDVSVAWAELRGLVFSTRNDNTSVASEADLTTGIFSLDIAGIADRHRRFGKRRSATPVDSGGVASRRVTGCGVSRTRTRNLVTSFVLIGLLGGAAFALVRYTARSRRLSEMQFRFAVGVSHDLRTPLTAIRGAAFNIADGLVTEPGAIKRYANLILRNAEELTSMIEKGIGVLGFFALRQGRNLIANAARHARQGRWIGVSAEQYADGVEVRVCDRGPGIPEAERERIFEPFYRSEQSRTAQVRGTGLGLSLVKDTVERRRGALEVHSSPGGGAQSRCACRRIPKLHDFPDSAGGRRSGRTVDHCGPAAGARS